MTDSIKKIRKILIANRGEIACRVIGTCNDLGIKTVAVYSDADRNAMHVKMADEAVHVGPPAASESYLKIETIIAAAKATNADAIHPGYGFLSENPEFTGRCAEEGIVFIGPSADAMNAMALKGAAKKIMTDADVPVVPGYHGDDQTIDTLAAEAEKIGFPVLIKAVAGGGGKGMRIVRAGDDIKAAIDAARREGENSFGNGKLLIEKLIEKPRHIELQVFGDQHGHVVHLFERDCSLQRRHQKVVEEAPAPGMSSEMRRAMGEAAVKAAAAIDYVGAGTVEFIVDVTDGLDNAPFYFMEMNTRLQVEHPVTEAITGQDLVEWQIRVAEGHSIPMSQDEIDLAVDGHAIEVRLYAEDPFAGFLPGTGTVRLFDPNASLPTDTRIDAGVRHGDEVSIHYDPMIGKLIAWGDTRDDAIHNLKRLISETPVSGLTTNRDFLLRALSHPEFEVGDVHTGFIDTYADTLLTPNVVTTRDYLLAAIALMADTQKTAADCDDADPWSASDSFRLNLACGQRFVLMVENEDSGISAAATINVNLQSDIMSAAFASDEPSDGINVSDVRFDGIELRYRENGVGYSVFIDITEHAITLIDPSRTITIALHDPASSSGDDVDGPGTIIAPMPGKILEVIAAEGSAVEKDAPILVMEAMKMEQTITAPRTGLVTELSFKAGDQVKDGAILAVISEHTEE